MPRAKGKKKAPEPEIYLENTQISSVIFGLVMVVAMIVAGAAMLGGSLSQVGQRWGSAMDGASRSVGLSVDTIEVIGLEHVPAVARQIKASAMVEPGENMFRADPHIIRRRVEDTRLVTNVRVYRLWPDTVMIYADAAEPTALWNDGDTWSVVDSLGRLMTKVRPQDHLDLVKTVGEGGPEAVPSLETAFLVMPDLRAEVDHARRVAGRRWDLVLKSGALVKLPNDEQITPSIVSFARMEKAGELTRRPLISIDLRVAGRVFLTPAQEQMGGAA
ncbi:MAG: cell division protein FtsQ/DivIB [Pseudomonadota bacterium]|jgi:cell division protein FtsQ|nr:cell division protein FtsQ/DivIB [Pseudomonadota bacterium]